MNNEMKNVLNESLKNNFKVIIENEEEEIEMVDRLLTKTLGVFTDIFNVSISEDLGSALAESASVLLGLRSLSEQSDKYKHLTKNIQKNTLLKMFNNFDLYELSIKSF